MPPETCDLVRVYEPGSHRLLATGHPAHGEIVAHEFACDSGNGALLAYYFGEGKREVLVQSGPNEGLHAQLGTRWRRNQRRWILDW